MCVRYVLVSVWDKIAQTYNLEKVWVPWEKSYNIGPGSKGLIITQEKPHEAQVAIFGLIPSWAKKRMALYNARSEGDGNIDDDPNYTGGMGIIHKPSFREPIRNKRCLVIADCFYEGDKIEGLNKPYLAYLRERRPFSMAGIYNVWKDPVTGEELLTYAIITTQSNDLMQKIGHHRSPVILEKSQESEYLNPNAPLQHITNMLQPYYSGKMNAYPVSTKVKNTRNNDRDLVTPLGELVYDENINYYIGLQQQIFRKAGLPKHDLKQLSPQEKAEYDRLEIIIERIRKEEDNLSNENPDHLLSH